jgi:hypothetical protein
LRRVLCAEKKFVTFVAVTLSLNICRYEKEDYYAGPGRTGDTDGGCRGGCLFCVEG